MPLFQRTSDSTDLSPSCFANIPVNTRLNSRSAACVAASRPSACELRIRARDRTGAGLKRLRNKRGCLRGREELWLALFTHEVKVMLRERAMVNSSRILRYFVACHPFFPSSARALTAPPHLSFLLPSFFLLFVPRPGTVRANTHPSTVLPSIAVGK